MGSATGGACCADEAEARAATEEQERRWGNGIAAADDDSDGDGQTAAARRRAAAVAAPPRRDAAEEVLTLRVFIGSGCFLERVERREMNRERASLSLSRRKKEGGKIGRNRIGFRSASFDFFDLLLLLLLPCLSLLLLSSLFLYSASSSLELQFVAFFATVWCFSSS